jgi:hypothetical protein
MVDQNSQKDLARLLTESKADVQEQAPIKKKIEDLGKSKVRKFLSG